jgi:hypothetical protein
MRRFVEGEDRQQATLLPACLDDYVTEDIPVRVIDVFIDELELEALGFAGVVPEVTGRPAYHPATLLKIDLVGYIRAYVDALDWLFDPANKLEALAVFRKNLPNISEDLANKSYEIMLHPTKGFTRRAELDVEGVKTVLELRSEYAEPAQAAGRAGQILRFAILRPSACAVMTQLCARRECDSYVPQVDWDGSWALPQRELLRPVGGH